MELGCRSEAPSNMGGIAGELVVAMSPLSGGNAGEDRIMLSQVFCGLKQGRAIADNARLSPIKKRRPHDTSHPDVPAGHDLLRNSGRSRRAPNRMSFKSRL
jgi:hypothetical protein